MAETNPNQHSTIAKSPIKDEAEISDVKLLEQRPTKTSSDPVDDLVDDLNLVDFDPEDPENPLNWPRWRRWSIILLVSVTSMLA
jgi:hypothetical protein